jgi:hypothetical protein
MCLVLCLLFLLLNAFPPRSLSQASEARALFGLSIAVDHPAFNSSPQVLCAAARACKAWREAVQQCHACNTAVRLNSSAYAQLQHQTSFRNWLHKHAALVKSISIHARPLQLRGSPNEELDFGRTEQDYAAESLLQQAMQMLSVQPHGPSSSAAALAPVTAARNAAAAAAVTATAGAVSTLDAGSTTCAQQQQQQQQQQQRWRQLQQ